MFRKRMEKKSKLASRALGSSAWSGTACMRGGRRLVLPILGPVLGAGIKAALQMMPLYFCEYTQLPNSKGEFAVMEPGRMMP